MPERGTDGSIAYVVAVEGVAERLNAPVLKLHDNLARNLRYLPDR